MASSEKKRENNSWHTPDGWEKEYLTNGIIWEDNMKLEPRIFERTSKILRKNSSSIFKAEKDDEKQHRNYWDTPREWKAKRLSQQWND